MQISDPRPDVLGEPWVSRDIPVRPNKNSPDMDHAVLVHQHNAATRADGAPLPRAVLYLPGLADYFFQKDHAQAWIDADVEFYGLDQRGQGRASAHLAEPENLRDLRLRNEEIRRAMHFLRQTGHTHITLLGHSTGGLTAVIYAASHHVDVLILNSPWLDLAQSASVKMAGTPVAHALARIAPDVKMGKLGTAYALALTPEYGGEWEFDPLLKPVTSFPVRAGFLSSVRTLQAELARGLGIAAPVLLACSTAHTATDDPTDPVLRTADAILDPADMVRLAPRLGLDVTILPVSNGIHDLALSPRPARDEYTAAAVAFSLAH